MRRNNDRMLLESLMTKYGNSKLKYVINKINESEIDIDDDSYYGGGLPDNYFNDNYTNNDRISKLDVKKLDNITDEIADIANNRSDDTELLFQAIECIEKFTTKYKNSINEMEERLEPITIYIDYVVDDSMQLRKDIKCFRKNDIKAECEIEEQFDNMELTVISEKSKYALTDWLLNYHLDDVDLIEEYWPELLPYVDDCEGKFVNYNNCF